MAFLLLAFALSVLLLAAAALSYRLTLILNPKRNRPLRHGRRNPHEPTHLMIVLGSGGHTAEILSMLERAVTDSDPKKRLDWKDYSHRTWVVGAGDSISLQRAKDFEDMAPGLSTQEGLMEGKVKKATDRGPGKYDIVTVPRAREIHQGLLTSPISSLKCALACRSVLLQQVDVHFTNDDHHRNARKVDFPDVILCNGPATATILVFTSILMRLFNVQGCSTRNKMRTIYVESWARVRQLSLSGRLLKGAVDRFLVQWPQLEKNVGGRAEYLGVLV